MQFAKEHFPGHQAIVATHDDGSRNHSKNIHVHIVINSVRAEEAVKLPYDARACDHLAGYKHNCTKPFLKYLQREVTKMCIEQGYHQVDFEHADRRITNQEYAFVHSEQKKSENNNPASAGRAVSEKEELRAAIEAAMAATDTENRFREFLQSEYGIQVKESRGRWGYLLPNREKPIRARKLGDLYEKESVLTKLRENAKLKVKELEEQAHTIVLIEPGVEINYRYEILIPLPENIGHLIDIEGSKKIKNSPAYEQWAKVHNLQVQAEQFAFMSEHGLIGGEELNQEYQRIADEYTTVHGELKSITAQIKAVNSELRLLGQYYSTRKEWREYCRSGKSTVYYQEHKEGLALYKTVLEKLHEMYQTDQFPDIKELKKQKDLLVHRKEKLLQAEQKLYGQRKELGAVIASRDKLTGGKDATQHTVKKESSLE